MFWEEESMLIVSDLHFGKTGHFRKSGIPVPQQVYQEDLQRLMTQLQYFRPKALMLTGDLFHSHANQEHEWFVRWRDAMDVEAVHLVPGNHDILPQTTYERMGLTVHHRMYAKPPFHFVHDLNSVEKSVVKQYPISGHIHPGIRISGLGKQSLRFPCFFFSKAYAILPSFSKFTGFVTIEPTPGDQVFAITPSNKRTGETAAVIKIQ